ncbi:MAG: Asp-tRNA(Asn)/Glu-tRNA(Gln) amidotransferase subunit GatC [Bacillota bacterium]|nr:Asp-tRNA(Asn)/Glu-tRNA(Gln) amidotransferase subunit GatC [Bacillota bacterium]
MQKEELERLARLSMFNLTDDEIDSFKNRMQSVITFTDLIEKAGAHADFIFENSDNLRNDTSCVPFEQSDILSNAPTVKDGFFSLPEVK